ncbi:putative membrane-anchored protein [Nocardia sp. GAS34]|uniref:COG4705 family protein n=1 Tax=unclassified Nocardia TaxID=2637762 RepID=UPI003D1EA32D
MNPSPISSTDSVVPGADSVRAGLSKVPEITALFWVIKILTTGMGETLSDFLLTQLTSTMSMRAVAIGVSALILAVALIVQFRRSRYVIGVYWFAVVMVSVFGTMIADVVHVALGVPYAISAPVFAAVLAGVFVWWHAAEKTLSIHTITTRRREGFYWATVMATFALGTSVGDLTATTLHLGYLSSGVLFAVAIAVPAIAYRWAGLGAIPAFWSAYVLTRPLGASVADWMGTPPSRSGLGWGTGPISLVWAAAILALVIVLGRAGKRRSPQS